MPSTAKIPIHLWVDYLPTHVNLYSAAKTSFLLENRDLRK